MEHHFTKLPVATSNLWFVRREPQTKDGSRKPCRHVKLTSASDRSESVGICSPNSVEPGAWCVNVWNQHYQTCRLSPHSVKFQEEYRDRCHLSLFQRYRAFHPFSDWLSQVEVFPAPVARGRNMCCVAHWARWEKSLKCLKEWSYTVVKSENKSTYRLLILDTILFFSSGCFLFVALIEWVLSSKVCR